MLSCSKSPVLKAKPAVVICQEACEDSVAQTPGVCTVLASCSLPLHNSVGDVCRFTSEGQDLSHT